MNEPVHHLFLARHGKSEANQPWLFLGRFDSPLCQEGIEQAQALAAQLASQPMEAIYTSPLKRARQTAEVIAKYQPVQPIVDQRLVEQDFGVWEGATLEEVKKDFAQDVARWQADALKFGPTQEESLSQVSRRTKEFCEDVIRNGSRHTLVIAHGSVLNALLCYLLDTPLRWRWAYPFDYCKLGEVALYEEHCSLIRFNS